MVAAVFDFVERSVVVRIVLDAVDLPIAGCIIPNLSWRTLSLFFPYYSIKITTILSNIMIKHLTLDSSFSRNAFIKNLFAKRNLATVSEFFELSLYTLFLMVFAEFYNVIV